MHWSSGEKGQDNGYHQKSCRQIESYVEASRRVPNHTGQSGHEGAETPPQEHQTVIEAQVFGPIKVRRV